LILFLSQFYAAAKRFYKAMITVILFGIFLFAMYKLEEISSETQDFSNKTVKVHGYDDSPSGISCL
jgi:hypothetical protein